MINDIEQIKEYDFFLYFSFQFFHETIIRTIIRSYYSSMVLFLLKTYVYLVIKFDETLILSFGTT